MTCLAKAAAVHIGFGCHLIDHIGALSSILDIPLLITEEKEFEIASLYYPSVQMQYMSDFEKQFSYLAKQFDFLFNCQFWACHMPSIFRDFYQKNMLLVHCAHGQSDKGYAAPSLADYSYQPLSLIYGTLLKNMLREMGIKARTAVTGNYRLAFYLKYKNFYDDLVEEQIFSKLQNGQKTVLFAPTWKDFENSSSFFTHAQSLFANWPDDWNLIFKPHPMLERQHPGLFYRIISSIENRPNIQTLFDFPLIYPLLARIDVYLGDYSSIGYDFLYFKKPMFFLVNPNLPKARLHSCGTVLQSPQNLFSEIEKGRSFTKNQDALYTHAFGAIRNCNEIKESIIQSVEQFDPPR